MRHSDIYERWKGRGKGSDDETIVNVSGHDYRRGIVKVWSNRGVDVCRILKRAGSVIEVREDGHGVWMEVPVSVFRGLEFMVKPVDVKSRPMSDEAKARFRAL